MLQILKEKLQKKIDKLQKQTENLQKQTQHLQNYTSTLKTVTNNISRLQREKTLKKNLSEINETKNAIELLLRNDEHYNRLIKIRTNKIYELGIIPLEDLRKQMERKIILALDIYRKFIFYNVCFKNISHLFHLDWLCQIVIFNYGYFFFHFLFF